MAVNGTTLTITGPIQIKRGTEAVLTVSNYIPAAGELVGAKDTGVIKMGDGTKTWANLPAPESSSTEIVNALTETVAGKALDAVQGKVLKEQIDALENITSIDCGEVTAS